MGNHLEKISSSWIKETIGSESSGGSPGEFFSVVVPTYNRGNLIIDCLARLFSQRGFAKDDFEAVIVDDGSTDNTSGKIRVFINSHPEYKVKLLILSKNFGPSTARNIGILHARGKFVAFTDDDCLVPEDWLVSFRDEFSRDPEISGVGGWKRSVDLEGKNPSLFDRLLYLRRIKYMRRRFKSSAPHPYNNCGDTANVCYKKEALLAVGGFDPRLRVMEDWELKVRMHKAGITLLYIPSFVEHFVATNFKIYVRDLLALGRECSMIASFHPEANFFQFTLSGTVRRAAIDAKNIGKGPSFILTSFFLFLTQLLLWYGGSRPIKRS